MHSKRLANYQTVKELVQLEEREQEAKEAQLEYLSE